MSARKKKPVELFTVKAWSANAIAFIEAQGLTREFSDWCGGWPCPVSPEMVQAAPDLLKACIWAEAALAPFSKDPAEKSGINLLRAAIAKATGEAA